MDMSFKPTSRGAKADPNAVEDEPVPTYEEWLDSGAKEVFSHPAFVLAKGAIEFVKFLWTRERLLISVLLQKDIIQEHEVEEFFGDTAHSAMEKEGVKQLTRFMMRAATKGELIGPRGKSMNPDDVLVLLNDILDLNNTGWDGRAFEIMNDMVTGDDLRADYEKEVGLLKAINEQRAKKRERATKQKEFEGQLREERERRVRIFISKCHVADKPAPSDEDQQQMLDGTLPIPEQP